MISQGEQSRKLRVKERRVYTDDLDDEEIEGGNKREFSVEEKINDPLFDRDDMIIELTGDELNYKYMQENGLRSPILVREKTGLGLRVPGENFTVHDVRQCVGSRRVLDVMDVVSQKGEEMTMKEWVQYYEDPDKQRLLNVISLEFSHTRLENYVEQPELVRQFDWIDTVWPAYLKEEQTETTNILEKMKYPKVQKYCLMSVGGCYTDFHIDMGGTSVWYHILKGKKIFWLIPPTEENLNMYEKWTKSGRQGDVFFGDKVNNCVRIKLTKGNTFFIPTGWIHAVFTPEDSIVFGGNFLHSLNIELQLRIWEIESRTHVPMKFRYPFFTELHWYVLDRYLSCVEKKSHRIKAKEEIKFENDTELKHSENGYDVDEVKTEGLSAQWVHLAKYELQGLSVLVEWLKQLPPTKKMVPKDIPDPDGLLNDAKKMLKDHGGDTDEQACSGISIIKWPLRKASKVKVCGYTTTFNRAKKAKPKGSVGGPHHRRVRCKVCEPCTRTDCRLCGFCHDMRKYGGPGRMKQTCISRQCIRPGLPQGAVCILCLKGSTGSPDQELMECGICWDITHPACYRNKYSEYGMEGIVNDDLPSSWECPKCVDDGKQGQFKQRVRPTCKFLGTNDMPKKNGSPVPSLHDSDIENETMAPPIVCEMAPPVVCEMPKLTKIVVKREVIDVQDTHSQVPTVNGGSGRIRRRRPPTIDVQTSPAKKVLRIELSPLRDVCKYEQTTGAPANDLTNNARPDPSKSNHARSDYYISPATKITSRGRQINLPSRFLR